MQEPNSELEANERTEEVQTTSKKESALLAKKLGLDFKTTLEEVKPPENLARGEFRRLIGSWGKKQKAIAIGGDDKKVIIAMSNPLNTEALDVFRLCYGREIEVVISPEEEIIKAINNCRTKLMSDRSNSLDAGDEQRDDISDSLKIDVTDAEDDDAPIIRYVNTLIFSCLLYTSPSPRDQRGSRMPSSA